VAAREGRQAAGGGREAVPAVQRPLPGPAALIEFADVTYRYPGAAAPALDGVGLRLPPGAFVAVLGGNGSGKSTLLRLMNGLLLPDAGAVRVAGGDTREPRARLQARRAVGLVFQNPDDQIVAPVVEDDVAFGPENLGLDPEEIARRVGAALEAVGLSDHRRSDPHRLSGGQKQRVAVAGILAMEPSCLCLDEATSLLDPLARREILDLVRGIHARGALVVLVTHHAAEAVDADRVVVLAGGRMAADGTPQAVLGAPERLRAWGIEPPPAVRAWSLLSSRGLLGGVPPLRLEDVVAALGPGPGGRPAPAAARRPPEPGPGGVLLSALRYTYPDPAVAPRDRRPALQDVDLGFRAGECLGLLGPSGSGKSTVALHCAAILRPDAGLFSVDDLQPWAVRGRGARARALRRVRRLCGIVFQYPEDQFFEERVLDEVAFAPRNFGAGPAEARALAAEALNRAGLGPEVAARSPFQLSGGQMRRVAIASVLAARPRYLVLDEPTAGLDAEGRLAVLRLVRQLRAAGTGVLLITHRMEEAAALADGAAVIHGGRIAARGAPAELFAAPERLAAWGLEPPEAAVLADGLRRRGWPLPPTILTLEDAVEAVAAAAGRR
jgi:energy-coupling factor transporter ATPase